MCQSIDNKITINKYPDNQSFRKYLLNYNDNFNNDYKKK